MRVAGRTVHRVTEGEKVISEEETTGVRLPPRMGRAQRELTGAGFTQTEDAERLLAWRLAQDD